MIIHLARIPEDGERLVGQDSGSILDLTRETGLRVESPVHYDVMVHVVSGRVIVKGAVQVAMAFTCSKCADVFQVTVCEPRFECIREFRDVTESVDLTDELREAILLNFPNFPVCRPACQGLCPRCGANLNAGPCGCGRFEEDDAGGPFGGLKL